MTSTQRDSRADGQRERRARRLAGLPRPADATLTRRQALAHHPFTWLVAAFFPLCAVLLWRVYLTYRTSIIRAVGDYTEELGRRSEPTINQFNAALGECIRLSLVTLVIGVVVFFLIDRLRPTTLLLKAVALFWGGAVAVYVSSIVNTWVSGMITRDDSDPLGSSRAAIFVAPFVEEAAKATILFLLAILIRYRIVSVMQSVTLAGLSAVGFAVVEDIIYYIRVYMYGSLVYGVDADDALHQLFIMRGLATCWGHPLFTSMTAIGMGVGLTHRSKLVRVVAPLAGFLLAALGHMAFNGSQTIGISNVMLFIIAGAIILFLIIRLVIYARAQGRLVTARLMDFVADGWLRPRDPQVFGSYRRRTKLCIAAFLRGPKVWLASLKMQHRIIELAYLRASVTVGTVDEAANLRGRELLFEIRSLRGIALDETEGLTFKPPQWTWANLKAWVSAHLPRRRRVPAFAPPAGPGVPVGARRGSAPAQRSRFS